MNYSQQNVLKQAEKIIENYSKKSKKKDFKKNISIIFAVSLLAVIVTAFVMIKCIV